MPPAELSQGADFPLSLVGGFQQLTFLLLLHDRAIGARRLPSGCNLFPSGPPCPQQPLLLPISLAPCYAPRCCGCRRGQGRGPAASLLPPAPTHFVLTFSAVLLMHTRLYLANAFSVVLTYSGTNAARAVVINEQDEDLLPAPSPLKSA